MNILRFFFILIHHKNKKVQRFLKAPCPPYKKYIENLSSQFLQHNNVKELKDNYE
jgi:hypothetical protein